MKLIISAKEVKLIPSYDEIELNIFDPDILGAELESNGEVFGKELLKNFDFNDISEFYEERIEDEKKDNVFLFNQEKLVNEHYESMMRMIPRDRIVGFLERTRNLDRKVG